MSLPHAQEAGLPPATGSAPSADDIALTREALDGAKLRPGRKMTIDTKLMKTRVWFTIEAWSKQKRQYITLSVGEVWRYETAEARDAVLAALTEPNAKFSRAADGSGPATTTPPALAETPCSAPDQGDRNL